MDRTANVRYLYDGTFDGLLCCVYESVYSREVPADICARAQAQPCLMEDRWIETDAERAQRVYRSIPKKICREAAELVRDVFCSCARDREWLILRFLLMGYRLGQQAYFMRGHAWVSPLFDAQRHLKNEAHLLLGFVRFSESGGVLTAQITPKNFVLPYIAGHFCRRLGVQPFLIWDKTHGAAFLREGGRARLFALDALELPAPDAPEAQFRALWRRFYDAIAIAQRENPTCRRTHCPMRYWENMTEFAPDAPAQAALEQTAQAALEQTAQAALEEIAQPAPACARREA